MRITQNMLNANMMRNLTQSYRNMDKFQTQLASGKQYAAPSDNPVAAVRGMFYRSSLIEIEQFKENALEAQNWLELTDSSMEEVTNLLQRARELTVQASNGVYAQSSLNAIADELSQLKAQLGNTANATIGGRYIFAGTDTVNPPYDEEQGKWDSINSDSISLEMSVNIYLPINIDGPKIFNSPAGNSVFEVFDKLINRLQNGGTEEISTYLGELDNQIDNVLSNRAALGARINRIELVQQRLDNSELNTKDLMSQTEDADIAKVITDLKAQENVHRAALSAGARIIMPTLMDFLR